ncbi:MAG: aspartate/glutamate racemase family protein, partial [Clostridia bacterium]|nr:aspartate/glutamate racemase family protein [Clostridia bacterium]
RRAAILATEGTILSGSYQRELERIGLGWMIPDDAGKAKLMDIIYGSVKQGVIPSPEELYKVSGPMFDAGCDCAILGCTELSLIGENIRDERFVDSLLVLAACSIKLMGHETVGLPESFS